MGCDRAERERRIKERGNEEKKRKEKEREKEKERKKGKVKKTENGGTLHLNEMLTKLENHISISNFKTLKILLSLPSYHCNELKEVLSASGAYQSFHIQNR